MLRLCSLIPRSCTSLMASSTFTCRLCSERATNMIDERKVARQRDWWRPTSASCLGAAWMEVT